MTVNAVQPTFLRDMHSEFLANGRTLRLYSLDSTHTYTLTDAFLSDIVAGDRINFVTLANPVTEIVDPGDGTADAVRVDADDASTANGNAFAAASGRTCGGFVTVYWTGTEATSHLGRFFAIADTAMDGGLDFLVNANGVMRIVQ